MLYILCNVTTQSPQLPILTFPSSQLILTRHHMLRQTMPQLVETPPALLSLFRSSTVDRRPKTAAAAGILRLLKMLPTLTSGCKMAALLGRPNKALLSQKAVTVTLFGYRRGRVSLAMQDDPICPPNFLVELPILTIALHREMASGVVKIALESEGGTAQQRGVRLAEECVWAVYCNGRKAGFSTRRKQATEEERHVMQVLRGVSMGAGVLPSAAEKEVASEGEMTYMRARFEKVVGSRDSEALYMINPDGGGAPELSIFLVRLK